MRDPIDVIIPTFDNLNQLAQCVETILWYGCEQPVNIIVVNNGSINLEQHLPSTVTVLTPGTNLGWTGGLQEGLKHSTSKYVLFANDDIFIPRSSMRWLKELRRELDLFPRIGAIGPTSNVVMGPQNIWHMTAFQRYCTTYLIGFCMLVRREALDKAGGVHDMEYGGDDLDLSIRLRQAGYNLEVLRDVFVYHHGFQTGEKVYGTPDRPNGWNSKEMTENVYMELIRKHGFMEFWYTIRNTINADMLTILEKEGGEEDHEGDIIRRHVNGGVTLELGCANKKTVPHAIGIDIIPKGEEVPYVKQVSVADIVADVSKEIPLPDEYADCIIARHILEHCLDPVKALKEWRRVLKPGGKVFVACPDERVVDGIPLNPQHLHAFTAESVESLSSAVGLTPIVREQDYNFNSFVVGMEKT